MPYVVEIKNSKANYPELCPFCYKRKADSKFHRRYSKAKWAIPTPMSVTAGYKDYKIEYPACKNCTSFIKYSKWIGYLLIFSSWLAFFTVILTGFGSEIKMGDKLFWIAIGSSIFSVVLLIVRFIYVLQFRVGYIGDNSVVFYSSKKKFSAAFAKLNNTKSVYKWIVFKLK